MKKMLCLGLAVLTLLFAATGCAGRAFTDMENAVDRGYGYMDRSMNGNVSTSRDGTVNGGTNSDYRSSVRPYSNMGVNDPATSR